MVRAAAREVEREWSPGAAAFDIGNVNARAASIDSEHHGGGDAYAVTRMIITEKPSQADLIASGN